MGGEMKVLVVLRGKMGANNRDHLAFSTKQIEPGARREAMMVGAHQRQNNHAGRSSRPAGDKAGPIQIVAPELLLRFCLLAAFRSGRRRKDVGSPRHKGRAQGHGSRRQKLADRTEMPLSLPNDLRQAPIIREC